jgi:cell division protein FtsB
MNQDGIWLSILDYASVKKTSISTIRRSIKAGHVKYREENGKYFIWTKEQSIENANLIHEKNELAAKLENEYLKKQNRELQEEINDLKMLLAVYEITSSTSLPPIPDRSL